MIKRIELINFMSHAHTVIEPAAGLTVLVGPNNCGKSAFVTALQILCHNDPSTYVLRHGAKECQVIVETSDGHVVHWSRKKSGSPKYEINGKTFDRLKRKVPPELHQALRLPAVVSEKQEFDVHFGEQSHPVFLLNDPGAAAAEFFASSSDAIRLVEMQSLHKQRVRDARRDRENLETEKNQLEQRLAKLHPLSELEANLTACEQQFVVLTTLEAEIDELEMCWESQVGAHKALLECEAMESCLASLQSPPTLFPVERLELLLAQYQENRSHLERGKAALSCFEHLAPPPAVENTTELEELIVQLTDSGRRTSFQRSQQDVLADLNQPPELEDLRPLSQLIEDIESQDVRLQRLVERETAIDGHRTGLQEELANWISENPVCPTCHSPTNEDLILPRISEGHGP